eukprot:5441651-Prymnesium_polylepis.1
MAQLSPWLPSRAKANCAPGSSASPMQPTALMRATCDSAARCNGTYRTSGSMLRLRWLSTPSAR